MSLLGTYFVATADEARDIHPDAGPRSPLVIVEGAVLMPDELSTLAEHLGANGLGYDVVASTDETWLVRLNDDFVSALANLPETISEEVADAHNLSFAEVDLLESVMRPLAARATARPGAGLYEWISL
jgi:hypothetical protein